MCTFPSVDYFDFSNKNYRNYIDKTTIETIPHFLTYCSANFGPQTAKSFFCVLRQELFS